jgi:PAS domain S-box-containing protein
MTLARVLIVEDDRVVARDIEQQLSRIGHVVVATTARGEDALPLAQGTQPDLVLMDIRLEGAMDGIDAAQRIREHYHIPVVFLTAYADDETVQRASLTEPFGYLLKPFEDSQLRTVIEMALYKHAAERKLRESERRFVTTLSSIGDGVIATDKQARVAFMNPVAEVLTGWRRTDAAGRPLAEVFRIVNEETRQTVEDPATRVLRTGTVVGLANHTVLLARDGSRIPIDDSGSPIIDDHGDITGAVLVFRDITQRRQAEDALRKAQADLVRAARLTTLGELTVSIAHEVNQPLMAIVTNAATCLQWLAHARPNIEEARQAAERVVRDGHRAGDFIASIRALAKKSAPQMTELDINGAILEILDLTQSEMRRHEILIEIELAKDRSVVMGDRVQLQQVILNLVMNGIEAMSPVADRARVISVSSGNDGNGNVVIAVRDTGIGFDATKTERMFDTFFTTKSEGIGLGLPICRSIVETHGGRLWASPNSPCGSVFRFTVPTQADRTSIGHSA